MGYLITHGENPYRAEWHIRKALGIKGTLDFKAAQDLYGILSRNIKPIEKEQDNRLPGVPGDGGSPSDLGNSISLKWEANETLPAEWHGFFPQRSPVNF
jgi:hypothetical protein